MNKILVLILLIMNVLCAFGKEPEKRFFYVGTYTSNGGKGIYLCNFDNGSGEISLQETFVGIDNPTFLKISHDERFLYAVTEKPEGYVSAFQIEKNC
jgi:6-phosphogluconolactonase